MCIALTRPTEPIAIRVKRTSHAKQAPVTIYLTATFCLGMESVLFVRHEQTYP